MRDVGESRGASTITQQVAKNLFLWQGRSFVRKALELPLAVWIYLVLPKRRVLEIYLNTAEWGPNGEFGAEAGGIGVQKLGGGGAGVLEVSPPATSKVIVAGWNSPVPVPPLHL